MPKKTVYVFDEGGKQIAHYVVILNGQNYEVSEQEFINVAKRNLKDDGVGPKNISTASFKVQDS
jgi:hypothetical protein